MSKETGPEATPDLAENKQIPAPTPEEIAQEHEAIIQKLKDDLAEAKEKYLRLYAEFDNHRRRTAKEKLELTLAANESLIKLLLPIMDDFERAAKSVAGNEKEVEGFLLIQAKLKKLLEQQNVKVMKIGRGSDFNPDYHEAITHAHAPTEDLKGKIMDVVESGYLLQEKVIRFAKVVIGEIT